MGRTIKACSVDVLGRDQARQVDTARYLHPSILDPIAVMRDGLEP